MIRNGLAGRYLEIIKSMSKNGFALHIKELGLLRIFPAAYKILTFHKKSDNRTRGERLRQSFEELGPTFVKFGQFLATRGDLLPKDITKELSKLHDHASPIPFPTVMEILQKEWNIDFRSIFKEFDPNPIGVASLGQVHKALLVTGEEVAVKIQRPHVEETLEKDSRIIEQLAELAENHAEWGKRLRISQLAREFILSLEKELDYKKEAANCLKMRKLIQGERIYIPKVYGQFTTKRAMMMEYVEGEMLTEETINLMMQETKVELADLLSRSIFQQIFVDGFFHADLHPGNILLMREGKVSFLDFGSVGKMRSQTQTIFNQIMMAMKNRDVEGMVYSIVKLGAPKNLDVIDFTRDIDEFIDCYMEASLSDISIGESIQDLFFIVSKHGIYLPSEFVLVGNTLLKLESTIEKLNPHFQLDPLIADIGDHIATNKVKPGSLAREVERLIPKYEELFVKAPDYMNTILHDFSQGQTKLNIHMKMEEPTVKRFEKIAHLIVLSIIMLALSIIIGSIILGITYNSSDYLYPSLRSVDVGLFVSMALLIIFSGVFISIIKSRFK
ncbi:ABC1 kinase family protein [Peribacillus acanthi]|uniref:ABC1 kinase family protein n=1 Tax=Peribacillus acanthi TaxID=2171554 RepID=UPI000D3EC544|nr:AarF/UbiB family protein [Peribacillus acanthi]